MEKIKVRWTPAALVQLESAREYIMAERPSAAERVLALVQNSTEALSVHPELGRRGRVEGTREFVVPGTPFIMAYRMRASHLDILAFLHGAQRWPEDFDVR